MNYRVIFLVCALTVAVAFSASWAQGHASGAAAKDSVAANVSPVAHNAAGDSAVHKKVTVADTGAAVNDTAAGKSAAKGLDLDKLLTGEHPEEDLLVGEKPVVKPAAVDSPSTADSPSTPPAPKTAEALAGEEKSPAPEPAAADAPAPRAAATRVTAVKTDSAGLAPLAIKDGRTINFAQNLKEYRSPRIAMLLSLLVPGLGQAYSRSYVKAGAFGAAEVAVIGAAAYLNSVAKTKREKAYQFADKHFHVENLQAYEDRLRGFVPQDSIPEFLSDYYNKEFYDAAAGKQTHYYESIRDGHYTPGWDDIDPGIDAIFSLQDTGFIDGAGNSKYRRFTPGRPAEIFYIVRVLDQAGNAVSGGERSLGYSQHQVDYNNMMDDSKVYYDAVNYVLYALIVNHIASAIDAGFTARAYNAWLLGRESAWNRVSVETQYVFTGSDVSPGLALRVRF
jgi:hypothetical protein